MGRIDWQDDQALQPGQMALEEFCRQKGLEPVHPEAGEPALVFVDEAALEALNQYLESDLSREHGGVLAGQPYRDPQSGCFFVDVQQAPPAIESEGNSVHLQFTPEAWNYIAGLMEESYPHLSIVGWYHSHPGLGVFMSGTDRASHRAFYSQAWSLALVVDPAERRSGWFAGPDCTPLTRRQVVPYRSRPGPVSTPPVEEVESSPLFRDLAWLLPVALLSLALAGLLLILRQRT